MEELERSAQDGDTEDDTDHRRILYDDIGTPYDTTRRADPYLADRLAHHLRLRADALYLDLACGTGNYTTALRSRGGGWHAADLSARMLSQARMKTPAVPWVLADAARAPYPRATFAGVLCTLAMHHFPDLAAVFGNVHRVLAPGGRFATLTSAPEQTARYWLAEYFPDAIRRSAEQMPSLDLITSALGAAGFSGLASEPYEVQEDLQDFFLYSGKHQPAMYLLPEVRRGISTFAALADPAELESGLTRLAADIESGRITEVQRRYRHPDGDYLFLVAEREPT